MARVLNEKEKEKYIGNRDFLHEQHISDITCDYFYYFDTWFCVS